MVDRLVAALLVATTDNGPVWPVISAISTHFGKVRYLLKKYANMELENKVNSFHKPVYYIRKEDPLCNSPLWQNIHFNSRLVSGHHNRQEGPERGAIKI